MLSLESIERKLENPMAHCVFQEFFHKAAVGEVRWKECMNSGEERIGNDTTEAFASGSVVQETKLLHIRQQKLFEREAPFMFIPTSIRVSVPEWNSSPFEEVK
jgi:hypothetical protein